MNSYIFKSVDLGNLDIKNLISYLQKKYKKEFCILESAPIDIEDSKKIFVFIDPVVSIQINDFEAKIDYDKSIFKDKFPKKIKIKYWKDIENILNNFKPQKVPVKEYGFLGFFGFESVKYIEQIKFENKFINDNFYEPEIYLKLFSNMLIFNYANNRAKLIYINSRKIDINFNFEFKYEKQTKSVSKIIEKPNKSKFNYAFEKSIDHISKGDIYQIQIGHDIIIDSSKNPSDAYNLLKAKNPSPYMFYWNSDENIYFGSSPEVFIKSYGEEVFIKPIAGTIKREKDFNLNQTAIYKLKHDPKEIAEHIMLVDLSRNDLSKIGRSNSLNDKSIMDIETYSHVNHMVSEISIKSEKSVSNMDILKAAFPAGTVCGTPKIKAMELISKYESDKRGFYAGILGIIGFERYINTCLLIRSCVFYKKMKLYRIRASAGIVYDSVFKKEWKEIINKMSAPYYSITEKELKDESFAD